MGTQYLKRILTARVYDVAEESPLEHAPQLSERMGNTLLLKREEKRQEQAGHVGKGGEKEARDSEERAVGGRYVGDEL